MIYRVMAVLVSFCCFASIGYSQPWSKSTFKDRGYLLNVQDASKKPNVWHAPKNSLSQFPRLSPQDCARYGSEYRYPECAEIPVAKTPPPVVHVPPSRDAVAPKQDIPQAAANARPAGQPVEKAALDVSLPKLIGQLLLVTFDGAAPRQTVLTSTVKELESGEMSGVLIRSHNVLDATQLRVLTALFRSSAVDVPLIAFEMPGGASRVAFTNLGLNPISLPREISQSGDVLDAFNGYHDLAAGLSALGVNLNFGPSINPCPKASTEKNGQCFGGKPINAAAFATAFNYAHTDHDILTAMRFDPSLDEGDSLEILRTMIEQKPPDVLIAAAPDPISPNVEHLTQVRKLLQQAGFRGALLQEIPPQEALGTAELIVDAVARGADLVLLSTPLDARTDVVGITVEAFEMALASGQISIDRVQSAYKKVQALKSSLVVPAD